MPDDHEPEDRLAAEAEELMRQRRYLDAASRYRDLRRQAPTDLWTTLGQVSALECAGRVEEAARLLAEAESRHRRSAHLQRFRHLFFVRREDFASAEDSRRALQHETIDEGEDDQLADLYFNQGRYHEARSELERLLSAGIADERLRASVLGRIGACLRQEGEFDAARERLREALAIEGDDHWTLSELAEVERAAGFPEAARSHYLAALAQRSDDHWTRGHLAQLEHEQGNWQRAVTLYEEILLSEPRAAWARIELAQVLTEHDAARSAALCREVLDRDPGNPWAHTQLGQLARRDGRLEEARKELLGAVGPSGAPSWVLHELADTCRQIGMLEEAHTHLDRAQAADPYDAATYGYRADFLRGQGRPAEALANLAKAVELDDGYAWAWRELAELKALAGDHPGAHLACRRACELEPDLAINDGLEAFLLRCQGRREAAIPFLERALERDAKYLWAWRELAEHHLAAGRPAEAVGLLQRAVRELTEAAPLHALLADALRRTGRRSEAEAAVRRAIAIDGSVPQLFGLLAELLVEARDHAGALAAAERALALGQGPEWATLRFQVLAAAGNYDEARTGVESLLAASPAPAPAWELATALAERAGDPARAAALLDQALGDPNRPGPHARDPRLLLRRARLALAAGEPSAPLLDAVLAADPSAVPWRDAAHVLAQAGRTLDARQAVAEALRRAGDDPAEGARAWLAAAEVELQLGDAEACRAAAARALERDDSLVGARILIAVVAGQRGRHGEAASELQRLDGQLPGGAPPGLLRQLAGALEADGRLAEAAAVWDRIALHPETGPALAAEHASFRFRNREPELATTLASGALAKLRPGSAEWQRLLRDWATALAFGDPERGEELLARHASGLDADSRALLVQLALASEAPTRALKHLDAPGLEPNRLLALLRARTLAALGRLDEAMALARSLAAAAPDDEAVALVLAQALFHAGQGDEALAVLAHPSLPGRPSIGRALLASLVALEHRGEAWALAWLARCDRPDHDQPLFRLFSAAWPGACGTGDPGRPAVAADAAWLPPFPRLSRRLGEALLAAGRTDLAGPVLLNALERHPGDRRLRHAAIRAQVRGGGWLSALTLVRDLAGLWLVLGNR